MSEINITVGAKNIDGCEYSNPVNALVHMFRHLFDCSGRATRKEFIMSLIGFAGLWGVLIGSAIALGIEDQFGIVVYWLFSVPCLTSLMMRRYHDFGYDGVLVILAMVVFPLWMFSMPYLALDCMLRTSQKGCNKYDRSSDGLCVEISPVRKSLGCTGWGCLTMLVLAAGMWFMSNLPLFFPSLVTQAQYSAEMLPVISNIRTKISLYVDEHQKLPGVDAVCASSKGLCMPPIQTFVRNRDATNETYETAYYTDDYQTIIPIKDADPSRLQIRHFADDIDLEALDLRGKRSDPTAYRYWAMIAASNAYAYCIGYFASGEGPTEGHVKPGTGYAVLEIMSTLNGNHMTRVATWERYKPINDAHIVLRPATNAVETAEATGEGTCWLGHPDLYLSDDPKRVEQGIQELKEAGWSFGEK